MGYKLNEKDMVKLYGKWLLCTHLKVQELRRHRGWEHNGVVSMLYPGW